MVSEAETGVNLPPMHPFCRSVTVPDTASRTGTRWARDPVTGKGITVPADMTYNQWYDKYVKTEKALKNNDKGDIISSSFKSLSGIYHPITDESIKRVSKIDIPGFSDELNDTIYEQRKALLIEMQKQPVGTEGSVSVPLNGAPIPNVIIGNIGSTKINNLDIPYYSVHNHPNSDVMSPGDILGFTSKQYKNMIGLEALGNDGKTLYSIIKTQNSDTIAYREYITKEVANFKSIYPDIDVQKDYEKIRAFSLKLFERGDEYGFITTRCE